jgi:hypothetical protein
MKQDINFKKVRFVKNENHVKDPVRFPKVIDKIENQSKKDFRESIELTMNHLQSEMFKMVK